MAKDDGRRDRRVFDHDFVDIENSCNNGNPWLRLVAMGQRKAKWVTVEGNSAKVSSRVRSTHRTWEAAQKVSCKARAAGESREVMCAQVVALMQAGRSFTLAIQMVAGSSVEAVQVEVAQ